MFKILSGRYGNTVGRGVAYGATPSGPVVEVFGGEDADYPLANLYDGRPSVPFRFGSTPATKYAIRWSNNLVVNGDMEQDTSVGWIASSGATVSDENTIIERGAQALKLVAASAGDHAYQDIQVHPGENMRLRGAVRGDGVYEAQIRIQNLNTGNWLQNGSWQATPESELQQTGITYIESLQDFQVEDLDLPAAGGSYFANEAREVTLRLSLAAEAAATVYFDEVLLIPGINHVSIHGHGFPRHCGAILAGAGASYWHSPSDAVLTGWDHNDQDYFTGQAVRMSDTIAYEMYPSVYVYANRNDTTTLLETAPWIGELVVGQTRDVSRNPDYPVTVEPFYPNVRYGTGSGAQWVQRRAAWPLHRITMSFGYHTDAEYREARERLYGMSEAGVYPLVLVPTETDSDLCVFGRVREGATFVRSGIVLRQSEFTVDEEPMPWVE